MIKWRESEETRRLVKSEVCLMKRNQDLEEGDAGMTEEGDAGRVVGDSETRRKGGRDRVEEGGTEQRSDGATAGWRVGFGRRITFNSIKK